MRHRTRTNRIPAAALILLAAVVAISGCGAKQQPRSEARRPNVVLIIVDALRADRLQCYGYSRATSPTLNEFAREGVLFTDGMSEAAETVLAVPSLLTGRRPREHGVLWIRRGDKVYSGPGLRLPTLATMLEEQGYVTAAISANPLVGPNIGVERGFDFFDQSCGRIATWQRLSAADVNQVAYRWLRQYRPNAGPFFLYLHYIDPHNLYRPPSRFAIFGRPGYTPRDDVTNKGINDLFDPHISPPLTGADLTKSGYSRADLERLSDLYDGEVLCADHYIGELFQRLKKLRLYDDTIIVVTADHGEAFLDHQTTEHGSSLYQEQVRIPLIIRVPGVKGGQEIRSLVESIDIVPTVLDALGVKPGSELSGQSLYGALTRGAAIADNTAMAELPAKSMHAVRLGSLKLIESPTRVELYDLSKDPHEQRDLSRSRPDLVRDLRGVLREIVRKSPPAPVGTEPASQSEIEALKSLGYIK